MHILLPTFLFPPFCSPGAMRLGRFVRHFAEFGGRVTVVTGSVADYEHGFPRRQKLDFGLLEELPGEVRLVRTEEVRPKVILGVMNWLRLGRVYRMLQSPDAVRRWNRTALRACREVFRDDPPDVIYTSSNPLSGHLIGLELAKEFRRPWVAEFRDPWTTSAFKIWETRWHHRYEEALQGKIAGRASRVLMNTPEAQRELLEAFGWLPPEKVEVVTNSFEAGDIQASMRGSTEGRGEELLIAHVGTMRCIRPDEAEAIRRSWRQRVRNAIDSTGQFRITATHRLGNSPWYLCRGLRQLLDRRPELSGKIRVVFAGRLGERRQKREFEDFLRELSLQEAVAYVGEVPYADALGLMRRADVLMLNQEFPVDGRACSVVPAKTYEYLAMEKPILGLLPPGDARDFVVQSGWGRVCAPDRPDEIARQILELYREHANGGIRGETNHGFLEQFRSDVLAKRVWTLFEGLTGPVSESRIETNPAGSAFSLTT